MNKSYISYTSNKPYDLIIIGAGPAGLTASIYASRYKLRNLVVGKILGGTITLASKIENYPGFVSISGVELGQKMGEQVKALGAEIIAEDVAKIEGGNKNWVIVCDSNKKYQAKALIIATGTERKRLGIPGEKEYLGKGVSYCTTCDAPFFKDKTVALIGGADSAVSGAIHTAEFAKKVYVIYRRSQLRAEPIWLDEWKRIEKTGKGGAIYDTNIIEIKGDGVKITGVKLDRLYQGQSVLPVDGVFIEIGGVPVSALVKPLGVEMTEIEYIKVNEKMETNVPGVYAAGDITDKSAILVQMITAMAQGAIAASSVYKYLIGKKAPQILGIED